MGDSMPDRDILDYIAILASPTTIAGFAWWLRGQFVAVKDHAAHLLDAHEIIDQQRHEQNLGVINRLDKTLTRLEERMRWTERNYAQRPKRNNDDG